MQYTNQALSLDLLPDPIMRVILQLHALRETFRRLRNAPSWP